MVLSKFKVHYIRHDGIPLDITLFHRPFRLDQVPLGRFVGSPLIMLESSYNVP